MLKLTRMGVIIAPPLPGFYNRPRSIAELVDHTVARTLDLFGLHDTAVPRWDGLMEVGRRATVPEGRDV